ncbi:MAG: hypothetical protein DMF94_33490 [Acidobacteria bacterium]|nr:MAG: hypothetical protein DMF94_33490 [Acidobacteriota bacterium]
MSFSCQCTREIQQGLGISGFTIDGLPKELDGLIRAPAPRAYDAQLRECRHVAGIKRQDAIVPGSRRIRVRPEQREVAQTPERFDVVRNELQDSLAQRRGLVVPVLLDAHLDERNQGLRKRRVLACGAFEDQGRFLEAAGEPKIVAEHDGIFRCELSFLVESTEVRDGEVVTAGGRIGHGARAAGHEHARILAEHGGQLSNGKRGLRTRRGHGAVETREKADAVFGIAKRCTGGTRGAASARIAECAQPLGCVGVDGRRGNGNGCSTNHLIELATEVACGRLVLIQTVGRLRRIVCQVVQFRLRSFDELEPRGPPGVERAPSQLRFGV